MKRIVILGGGTGGTLLANRLRRAYRPEAAEIVVVDRDDAHVYQPGLLFVPFGLAETRRLTRPRWRQLRSGITYCQTNIDHVDNVRRFLAGEPLAASFDGHTNCFIETGRGRALLIDFNYDTEPLTGHYPGPIGLPLLRPSRLNHLGKLAFQQLYWHGLLPGHDIPGISPAMPARGKNRPANPVGHG